MAPWPRGPLPGEIDASPFAVAGRRRTGAAVPRAPASRPASPGTFARPPAPTSAAPPRCTSGRSTGGPGRSGCTGKTSAGTPAGRTSRTEANPAPHTLHAVFWRHVASRCTSRPTAGAPRTRARRARWASQWLLRGPSSSWASLSAASGVVPHSSPTSFQSPPPDPHLNHLSPVSVLDLNAVPARATTTATMVINVAVNSTSTRIHADLGDRSHSRKKRLNAPSTGNATTPR